MCMCVLANVCLHLGVMICEIIYCPSELQSLRTSSLLSKPVIPHSQHKKHWRAIAPRPTMHKTLLPQNTVSIEKKNIYDELYVYDVFGLENGCNKKQGASVQCQCLYVKLLIVACTWRELKPPEHFSLRWKHGHKINDDPFLITQRSSKLCVSRW